MEHSDRLRLQGIIDKIASVKVLVVGDMMLDRYWWGDVTRISPEAPVPVVRLRKDTFAAGGAANVAANVAGIGASAFLVGVVGDDAEGERFVRILGDLNIRPEFILRSRLRPTTVKTRIVANNQQVVRVDQEETGPLSIDEEEKIWASITKIIEEVDVVIVSDYAKGVLTCDILARLITKSNEIGKPVLVDPKGKDYLRYSGASLLTPNRKEAAEACHLENDTQDLVDIAGNSLLNDLNLGAVLITQGEDGMTMFRPDRDPVHLDAMAQEIFDVTGAGDTVIACLGAAMAAGASGLDAARIANIGASLVIQHVGTTFLTADDFSTALNGPSVVH
ncbi:MAG TPA: D-glycero-beta-D-manno-heptose-7-phosphate kinase [Pyrinomonadaceae bacterium]|nr:D-glycero-beta-D-manno-heptose-7-phosphate kinase [Pyrinomonadaceae bacterium]